MTDTETWTIGKLLKWTTDYLRKHGAESARLEAEILLAHARGCQRIELYTAFDQVADDRVRDEFRQLVRQRAAGTPVAYLVGQREFYSLAFQVTPDVLIPRPETEFLVIRLLDLVKQSQQPVAVNGDAADEADAEPEVSGASSGSEPGVDAVSAPVADPVRVLDVGTGSGVLAICAALYLPLGSQVTAVDISPAALEVARRNAEQHKVEDRITFLQSDLLDQLPPEPQFDYVLSNPPYVSESEYAELDQQVRDFEPRLALVGGPAGTELYARLIPDAAERLVDGGRLLMELSPMICEGVEQLLQADERYTNIQVTPDLAQLPRVIEAQRTDR